MVLHVTGAHAYTLPDRALAFLLQQADYLQPRRIGYGFKCQDELFIGHVHIYDCQYMRVSGQGMSSEIPMRSEGTL